MIQLEPDNKDAYNGLATALFMENEYILSLEVLTTAIARFPQHVHTTYNLGNVYYKLGQFEEAVSYLRQVTELHTDYLNTESLLEKALKRLEVQN